jgi:hypothetical protein
MAISTHKPASHQDAAISAQPPLEPDRPCPPGINELQSVLRSIMIAEEERPTRLSIAPAPPQVHIENKWAGTFSLFSFPREIRDEIYYHYLYRPHSIYYSRTTLSRWPFHADDDVVSLLLTCAQVYHEAIEVFHEHNEVEIGSRPRLGAGPEKVLKMFPTEHAQKLRKCRREYGNYKPDYLFDRPLQHFPGECWLIMIRDAYLAKTYFPNLRLFTASWKATNRYFDTQEQMDFTGKTEEEKVQMWLDWMRFSTREMKALPPSWLKVELRADIDEWGATSLHEHQSALHEAQVRFSNEVAAEMGAPNDLEALGNQWATDACKEMMRIEIKRRKEPISYPL